MYRKSDGVPPAGKAPALPARPVAAHVQAAVQAGRGPAVQPKALVTPVRPVAPHVQAATARPTVQPRALPPAPRPLAPHVAAAVASPAPPRPTVQARPVAAPPRPAAPHAAAATAATAVAQRKPASFIPPPPARPSVIQRATKQNDEMTYKEYLEELEYKELIKREIDEQKDYSDSSEEEPSDDERMDYQSTEKKKKVTKQARVLRFKEPKHLKSARNQYTDDPKTPLVIKTPSNTYHMVKLGRGKGAFILNPANRPRKKDEENVGNEYPAIINKLSLSTQQDEIEVAKLLLRIMKGEDVSSEVKNPTRLFALNKLVIIQNISEIQRGKEATRMSTYPGLHNIALGKKPKGYLKKMFAEGKFNSNSIFLGAPTTKSKHGGGAKILETVSKGDLSDLDLDQLKRVGGELREYYERQDSDSNKKRKREENEDLHKQNQRKLYKWRRTGMTTSIKVKTTTPNVTPSNTTTTTPIVTTPLLSILPPSNVGFTVGTTSTRKLRPRQRVDYSKFYKK